MSLLVDKADVKAALAELKEIIHLYETITDIRKYPIFSKEIENGRAAMKKLKLVYKTLDEDDRKAVDCFRQDIDV